MTVITAGKVSPILPIGRKVASEHTLRERLVGTVDPKRSGTVARIMPGGSTTSGMADPMDGGTSPSSPSTSTSTSFN